MLHTSFAQYLQSKNLQPDTIQKYIRKVELFELYSKKELDEVKKKDILDYLTHLQVDKNLSNASRQKILGVLKHYYEHLMEENDVSSNPTRLIHIRGTKKKILYKILTMEQLNEFMDLHHLTFKEQIRNSLLLSLYLYQGIQINEWKALKISDINLVKGTIYIAESSRTNARKLPLQPIQIGLFYTYLQGRTKPEMPLFTDQSKMQKWQKVLRKLYPLFSDFAQIRSSLITHWIQTEGLRKAQYKAGHRYISSTEAYICNDLESLKDDIAKFHPL
jgi:site-specific recombinase XerD